MGAEWSGRCGGRGEEAGEDAAAEADHGGAAAWSGGEGKGNERQPAGRESGVCFFYSFFFEKLLFFFF